jgi:hypothetical protein
MTAATIPQRRSSAGFLLLLAVVAIIGVWLAGAVSVESQTNLKNGLVHAYEKHGLTAIQIKQCFDGGGAIQYWRSNQRNYYVCDTSDLGCYSLVITEFADKDEEFVTCYPKSWMGRKVEKLMRFLRNLGAAQVW